MAKSKSVPEEYLVLDATRGELPLVVSPRAWRRFARTIDRSLDKLVARWIHEAAPVSRHVDRLSLRLLG